MPAYDSEKCEVDLFERVVLYPALGIWFRFYEAADEEAWERDSSVLLHSNPTWRGDYGLLADAAKRVAVAAGMRGRKPDPRLLRCNGLGRSGARWLPMRHESDAFFDPDLLAVVPPSEFEELAPMEIARRMADAGSILAHSI